jgi:hypothetical protein
MFPVLEAPDGCPKSVPWALLAPHEAQAKRNHDQTLERLAQRGGLAAQEMVDIIAGNGWSTTRDENRAVLRVLSIWRQWWYDRTKPGEGSDVG